MLPKLKESKTIVKIITELLLPCLFQLSVVLGWRISVVLRAHPVTLVSTVLTPWQIGSPIARHATVLSLLLAKDPRHPATATSVSVILPCLILLCNPVQSIWSVLPELSLQLPHLWDRIYLVLCRLLKARPNNVQPSVLCVFRAMSL